MLKHSRAMCPLLRRARFKSVQSLYSASAALPADHAYNTKHNTFTIKHRSK